MLSNIKIVSSELSNCRIFDADLPENLNFSDIYFVSSRRYRVAPTETEEFKTVYDIQKDKIIGEVNNRIELESIGRNGELFNTTADFSTACIASAIEQKILNSATFYCDECRSIFGENTKIHDTHDANLLKWKPCQSTLNICKAAERFFKLFDVRSKKNEFDFKVLYCLIFRTLDFNVLFEKSSFACDSLHKYQLIKCIVGQYIARRATNVSKNITLDQFEQIFRQKYNHIVTFSGQ